MLSLSELAQRNPRGTAVICGERSLDFANLFDKSEAIVSELELTRFADQPIAFIARSNVPTIALIYALMELRIPILPLHPRLTESEQRELIDAAGARWLEWPSSLASPDSLEIPKWRGEGVSQSERSVRSSWVRDTQLLIATSGSSGKPKLVRLPRRALAAAARASVEHLQMTSRDRWLLSLGLAHVGGFSILLRCLAAECAVVVALPGLESDALAAVLSDSAVTLASFVPTQLERLLSAERRPLGSSLRAVLIGGAPTSPALLAKARAAGVPALATYGLSECCAQIATQPLSDLANAAPLDDAGVPLPGVELEIRAGRIWVRTESLFDGYLPESGPVLDRGGWFQTSDLGRISRGRLIPLGRSDDCIVTGGEKVAALEVERALLRVSKICSAVVVGLPDPEWGQVVAAALVLEPGAAWPECLQTIERLLSTELASFKRPKRWLRLYEMPLLPSGKVDRSRIRAEFSR